MNTPFNELTDAQAERLALLAEELGESIQWEREKARNVKQYLHHQGRGGA